LADSCALQNLSSEVARAGDDVCLACEGELRSTIASVAEGFEGKPKARREEATALLALSAESPSLAPFTTPTSAKKLPPQFARPLSR
jgi:TetR/AcrR family transcriptional regulator, transcriptional repressor for nem operon